MTAPSAPGVALYEGAIEDVAKARYMIDTGAVSIGETADYSGSYIGEVLNLLDRALAALNRDALDRATNPERRRAVAEVPADDDGWGPWRTDVSEWNVTTHDVRFECVGGIHKISTRPRTEQPPQPEAAPTPAPDWEALVAALKPFAKAWEVAMLSSSGGRGLSSGQLGALAAHEVAGVHFQRAAALIAAMQEPKS